MAFFNSYSGAIDNYWRKHLQCSDQQISLPSSNAALVVSTATPSLYASSVVTPTDYATNQIYPNYLYSNVAYESMLYNDVSSPSGTNNVRENCEKIIPTQKYIQYSHYKNDRYSQCNEEQYSKYSAGIKVEESCTNNESICDENLEFFAEQFKVRRMALGYTQAGVGAALAFYNNGFDFSQTTICRFENLQLSYANACKLKPLLAIWMERTGYNSNQKLNIYKRRKRRTTINAVVKEQLEKLFYQEHKPSPFEISSISAKMNLNQEVVRVWFSNRRQRQKRFNSTMTQEKTDMLIDRYNFNYQVL